MSSDPNQIPRRQSPKAPKKAFLTIILFFFVIFALFFGLGFAVHWLWFAGIQGGVAVLLATGSSADLEAVLDLLPDQLRTFEEVAVST